MDIWKYLHDIEINKKVDIEACRKLIFNTTEVYQVKEYLDDILRDLKFGKTRVIDEARSVALPISYRLSLDDTSSDYRISSKINTEIFRLENPKLSKSISDEIKNLIFKSFKIRYSGLKILENQIVFDLSKFSTKLDDEWHSYGRVKEIFSIYYKLFRFKIHDKQPKKKSDEVYKGITGVLQTFEENVCIRLNDHVEDIKSYDTQQVMWIVPDLIAITIQLSIKSDHTRNLGSLKSKYKSVNKKLKEEYPLEIFYGPSYSNKWHINRLVSYAFWNFKNYMIPIELFIRTDFDYFIGYANYWRYKGVHLFAGTHKDSTSKSKKMLINKIHECNSFYEVQNMLYREIKSGQLELF
ncbi:MAG: hypothetical protein WD048_05170 [Chitinophagales bacterium]